MQFWEADERLVDGYVESDGMTLCGARGYSRTLVMARLSGLEEDDLRDVLVESWQARTTATLRRRHADLARMLGAANPAVDGERRSACVVFGDRALTMRALCGSAGRAGVGPGHDGRWCRPDRCPCR